MHYSFMNDVIDMASNRRYFEEWEIQQLNDYVEYKARQNAINDGIERGVEQTKLEHIKNMISEGISIDVIARITNKTEEDIMKIKESF